MVWDGLSGLLGGSRSMPPVIPRPGTVSKPSPLGYVELTVHDGPSLYLVHDIDGEVFTPGATYKALFPWLSTCRCVALEYNKEARNCKTLAELAELYNERVLEDVRRHPRGPIYIVAYSLGGIIAHQMALQLQESTEQSVGLILCSSEVTWPDEATIEDSAFRMGTYEWLGGAIEAALHVARTLGSEAVVFAQQEVKALLGVPKADHDPERVQMRTFWKHAGPREMFYEDFIHTMRQASLNMDRLHSILAAVEPLGPFRGRSLLLLAAESPEFAGAEKACAQHCPHLQVLEAQGSHYSMLQEPNVESAARAILAFLGETAQSALMDSGGMVSTPVLALPTAQPGFRRPSALEVLQSGSGPLVCLVLGCDGDAASVYGALAPLLAPCHCCALTFDEEAYGCADLVKVAALYLRRVLDEARARPQLSLPGRQPALLLLGYSFGCVIAHQMALQAQKAGERLSLVLLDSEVTCPPHPNISQPGGYEWLGSDIEATLLLCRSFGLAAWVSKEVRRLLALPSALRDPTELKARACEEMAKEMNIVTSEEEFRTRIIDVGCSIQKFHAACVDFSPQEAFEGEALLVLASDSAQGHNPKDVNTLFCRSLETVTVSGTHHSILQRENVSSVADCVFQFMHRWGHSFPEVSGLVELRTGDGPRCYMVHGIDGDIFATGANYRSIAPLLAPCNCSAFIFDEEAHACDTLVDLATLYLSRALRDARRHARRRPLFMVGYSFGCVVAHQMALQAQDAGLKVGLILLDFEVTYPVSANASRLGGYQWLGGEIEATLLICRSQGLIAWATAEVQRLSQIPQDARDVGELRRRAFRELSKGTRRWRQEEVDFFVNQGGRKMQRMHTSCGTFFAPSKAFEGQSLLVVAPETGEFHEASRINRKYCSCLEEATALGNHYTMLQAGQNAAASAARVRDFLERLGHSLVPGTETSQVGDGDNLYILHDIDGDSLPPGSGVRFLLPHLVSWRCVHLLYDEQVRGKTSLSELMDVYEKRVVDDISSYQCQCTAIVGYAFGCVIAHQLALRAQQRGIKVKLVLLDGEVTYPFAWRGRPPNCDKWLGGMAVALYLIAQRTGNAEWCKREVESLSEQDCHSLSAEAAAKKVLQLGVASSGHDLAARLQSWALDLDRLHSLGRMSFELAKVFEGSTLLVLPSHSPHNQRAKEANERFCSSLEVAEVPGTPGTFLQEQQAAMAAEPILAFLGSPLQELSSG